MCIIFVALNNNIAQFLIGVFNPPTQCVVFGDARSFGKKGQVSLSNKKNVAICNSFNG